MLKPVVFLTIMTVLLTAFFTCGCSKTYYAVWEKFGKEKRHLLRGQVEKAQEEQEQASEQFQDVLGRIKQMYSFDGGELEKFYSKLKNEYDDSEEMAKDVQKRIDNVEEIGRDLFKEWQEEIQQITNRKFQQKSQQSLRDTQKRFARLQQAMVKAEKSMGPVLENMRNYVLYLKHNLNAQAIGALKQEVVDIENDVANLVSDMTQSIKEADQFLKDFQ